MMRLLCNAMIFASMVAGATSGYAQGAAPAPSATGTVVNASKVPLSGVPVQVTGPKGTTFVFTDESGKWSLYNLPAGTYQAQAIPADETNAAKFNVEGNPALSGRTVSVPRMMIPD